VEATAEAEEAPEEMPDEVAEGEEE